MSIKTINPNDCQNVIVGNENNTGNNIFQSAITHHAKIKSKRNEISNKTMNFANASITFILNFQYQTLQNQNTHR